MEITDWQTQSKAENMKNPWDEHTVVPVETQQVTEATAPTAVEETKHDDNAVPPAPVKYPNSSDSDKPAPENTTDSSGSEQDSTEDLDPPLIVSSAL